MHYIILCRGVLCTSRWTPLWSASRQIKIPTASHLKDTSNLRLRVSVTPPTTTSNNALADISLTNPPHVVLANRTPTPISDASFATISTCEDWLETPGTNITGELLPYLPTRRHKTDQSLSQPNHILIRRTETHSILTSAPPQPPRSRHPQASSVQCVVKGG